MRILDFLAVALTGYSQGIREPFPKILEGKEQSKESIDIGEGVKS